METETTVVKVKKARAPKVEKKSSTDVLAELMLKREAVQEQEKLDKEAKYKEADARRKASDGEKLRNENRKFANCDHLQGNHKNGEAPFREISHMSLHTFGGPSTVDRRRIRCNKCGHKWYPGDGADTYRRDAQGLPGKKGAEVPNPTGISWLAAYKTVTRSKTIGNKPSTGFIDVMQAAPQYEE